MVDSRFTDNSAGTRMDLSPEAFLALDDKLGLSESEQRAWIVSEHARGRFGWIATRALKEAGWLPEDADPHLPSV